MTPLIIRPHCCVSLVSMFSAFGRAKPLHLSMAGGLYLFFAVFLLWPIAQIVRVGLVGKDGHFTWEYVNLIFSDPLLKVRGLINAAVVAVCVTGSDAAHFAADGGADGSI